MRDATITASPFSYSKTCDTSRPRGAGFRTARRTGLGRTFLIDFFEQCSVRNRFVRELVSQRRPGCVVDAVRHPGFGECRGGHMEAFETQIRDKMPAWSAFDMRMMFGAYLERGFLFRSRTFRAHRASRTCAARRRRLRQRTARRLEPVVRKRASVDAAALATRHASDRLMDQSGDLPSASISLAARCRISAMRS